LQPLLLIGISGQFLIIPSIDIPATQLLCAILLSAPLNEFRKQIKADKGYRNCHGILHFHFLSFLGSHRGKELYNDHVWDDGGEHEQSKTFISKRGF